MSLNTPRFSVILVGLSLAFLGPQVGGCNEAPELEEPLVCDNLLQAPELTTESLQVHMAAFSDAASIHGGNRAGGSPGFDASADYAQEVLEAAGYTVRRDSFEFQKYEVLTPPTLAQNLPNARSYTLWQDFVLFRFGRSGDASGRVVPVAVDLDNLDEVGTSGCEPADFNDFPSGEIALIRRGGCPHEQKALHAQDAGAIGVIEFNNVGDTLFDSRFSPTSELAIPVLFVTETLGLEFAQQSLAEDLYMTMHVETSIEPATTFNLIADHPGGDPDGPVVMFGGHLDSVHHGPGLNDNGSGSVATIATALALSGCEPNHRVRAALWGAEEYGLLGSAHYIRSLDDDELAEIGLYLNFDMVGSPNFARQIYDGDGSSTPDAGPPGSAQIEDAFVEFFRDRDQEVEATAFSGRSDYGPFIAEGIPSGGLFTGASATKTDDQVAAYGGELGIALDPCYHTPCDGWANLDWEVLTEMTAAAATVTAQFATSVSSLPERQEQRSRARNTQPELNELGELVVHSCEH